MIEKWKMITFKYDNEVLAEAEVPYIPKLNQEVHVFNIKYRVSDIQYENKDTEDEKVICILRLKED